MSHYKRLLGDNNWKICDFRAVWAVFGHFWEFWAIFGRFWEKINFFFEIAQNDSKWPKMTINDEIGPKRRFWSYLAIFGCFWPFWAIFKFFNFFSEFFFGKLRIKRRWFLLQISSPKSRKSWNNFGIISQLCTTYLKLTVFTSHVFVNDFPSKDSSVSTLALLMQSKKAPRRGERSE